MGNSLSSWRWALGCLAACLISAAPAAASTVPLGQTAPSGTAPSACADCTSLQQASGASPSYTVPSDGTLTSWSIQGSPSALDCAVVQCVARLRVLRPDGSGHYVVADQSALETIPANTLSSFPVSIPVQAGDVLGLEGTQVPVSYAGSPSDVVGTVTGLPVLGSLIDGLGGLPLALDPGSLLNVSVVVDVGDPAAPGSGGGTTTTTPTSPAAGQGQSQARFTGVRLSRRTLRVGRSGWVRIPVACPAAASGSCRGTLRLLTVHAVSVARTRVKLASGRFNVPAGRSRSVLVRISRSGRRALAKRHRLAARLTASARDASGQLRSTSRTLTVAQPSRARTTR